MRRKEQVSKKKCPAAMKERKKNYWTCKSVAHARITTESRSQSQSYRSGSTPSTVLELKTPWSCGRCNADRSPPSAPSYIAKGSMRSITRVADCSGALRAIMGPGSANVRSRVLAAPRGSGRHFGSKCDHCACSVSHEQGPNARSYVQSPPPPPPPNQTFLLVFTSRQLQHHQKEDKSENGLLLLPICGLESRNPFLVMRRRDTL